MVERRTKAALTPRARRKRSARPREHRRWFVLRVILLTGRGEELVDPPGRDLLINDRHTFEDIARAIDRAFARWDLSHLHEFGLLDGRRIAMEDANESAEMSGEQPLDERLQTLTTVGLDVGETFQYLFDFGDGWEHGCTLLREDVDPVAEWGSVPKEIVPIFGWGTIPDQCGRSSAGQGETG